MRETNQEAEREVCDDGESNGDGGKLDISDMANEYIGERIDAIVTENIEGNRSCNGPELDGLHVTYTFCVVETMYGRIILSFF